MAGSGKGESLCECVTVLRNVKAPFLLPFFWGSLAFANPLQIAWVAPAECPSEDYVVRETTRLSGEIQRISRSVRARAVVAFESDRSWTVTLVTNVDGSDGHRSFSADSCQDLADATALILAMSANAPALVDASSSQHPIDTTTPEAVTPSINRPHHRFEVGASLALDSSTMPSPCVGPAVDLSLLVGTFRIEASAAHGLSQRVSLEGSRNQGADFQLWTLGARAGPSWSRSKFELGPFAGMNLELLQASGFGGEKPHEQGGFYPSLAAGALVVWRPLGSLSLRFSTQAVLPFARPSFVVVESNSAPGLLHRPASLTARGALGLGWDFL